MLTGLDLMFMGLTQSYSGRFSTPGFLVSPVGKRERGEEKKREREKKKKGRREKGNRKGKEGRGNKERSEAR